MYFFFARRKCTDSPCVQYHDRRCNINHPNSNDKVQIHIWRTVGTMMCDCTIYLGLYHVAFVKFTQVRLSFLCLKQSKSRPPQKPTRQAVARVHGFVYVSMKGTDSPPLSLKTSFYHIISYLYKKLVIYIYWGNLKFLLIPSNYGRKHCILNVSLYSLKEQQYPIFRHQVP